MQLRTGNVPSRAHRRLAALTGWGIAIAPQVLAAGGGGGIWETGEALNVARQETGAAVLGDQVYVAGGLVSTGFPLRATDTVERRDLDGGPWSLVAPMPERRDHAAVAALDGRLYVAGGFDGDFVSRDTLFVYDPVDDEWTLGPPLPEPVGAGWAVAVGGELIVVGGTDAFDRARRSTFLFDPRDSSWRRGADMPTAREHLVAVAHGGFVYAIGGRNGLSNRAHERYDPVADSWQELAPMPTARSAMGAAVVGDRIVVAGGEVPVLFSVNEIYDVTTDRWSCQRDMPVPRHGVAAVSLGDRVLFPAGGEVQGVRPSTHVDTFLPGATLALKGACPGAVTVEATGLPPLAPVGVLGAPTVGTSTIPAGLRCGGTELDVGPGLQVVAVAGADGEGELTLPLDLPDAACGAVVQLIDATSCTPSALLVP